MRPSWIPRDVFKGTGLRDVILTLEMLRKRKETVGKMRSALLRGY
ncbi:hypothetical protein [Moorena sp. SIO3I8]|nr:hypothetical protein [Moorena sp. SIO3I8]